MKAPLCQNCGKYCNPAGGVIGTDIKFWRCFNCGYEVEDAVFDDCTFKSNQPNLMLENCELVSMKFDIKAIPDTEWSEILKIWNTKIDHKEDMGK